MGKWGAAVAAALWLAGAGAAAAQEQDTAVGGRMLNTPGTASTTVPTQLVDVGFEQKLGARIPADATFTDETGRTVRIGDYYGEKPILLTFVYYQCPMLCNQVMAGITTALGVVNFDIGKEFEVVALSFDPRDTPEGARAKKATFVQRYKRPGTEGGWHYLVGDEANIRRVTDAAGFTYRFDAATGQFAHASGALVLTPDGTISRVFYGVEFSAKDLRLAIVESSAGKIGTPVDKLLLYCFHYDPTTGKYGLMAMNLMRLGGAVTVVVLATFLLVNWRRDRQQAATTGRA